MIIYEATKSLFLSDADKDLIADKIETEYFNKTGANVPENEFRSWKNSMIYMSRVLSDDAIPGDAGIAIEYKLPYTSKRIDFIISGKTEDELNSAIIIELKQWESMEAVADKDGVVRTFLGGGIRETTHPSYQAWSYAAHIEDYNAAVQDRNVKIKPCAYLHNYQMRSPDPITNKCYNFYLEKAPVFASGDAEALRSFIKRYVKKGDAGQTLYIIENGKIRPSKSLQDALANMLKGSKEFVLIDDQKLVYETAIKMAKQSVSDLKTRVLVVRGGPGTGKSVLAINLLVELSKQGLVCQYATKNAAPRNVFIKKLEKQISKGRLFGLFKSSGSYVSAKRGEIDVLIADEAHRLNEKSGLFRNQGENQIKEIIRASKFSVFFIDESQRVDINDIGTLEEISRHINEAEAETELMDLPSQFRCNGSDGYMAWVDDLLGIRETANADSIGLDYDIKVFDSLAEMRDKIFELNEKSNKARLLAGYCWNWKSEGKNDPNVFDIEIPDQSFAMSWNLGNSATWAIDPDSVNQVGCIHTSQGLEFEYVGVIFGKDLRYENGKIMTDFTRRASTDKSLFGIKAMHRSDPQKALKIADEIIKNTYRTLMTRGMKGCYIYCEDKALAEHMKRKIALTSKTV